ncbi:MAG: hypothetical protein PF574_03105 [Candidatus Delongbacteria bacterium]|jgi:hypothetical protein|nr:hypothetical protein [Candidatus Delongbacteria bacterium]
MKKILLLLVVILSVNLFSFELMKFIIVESPKDDISEMKKLTKPKFMTGETMYMVFDLGNCNMKNNTASITYSYELKASMKSVYKSRPEIINPGMQSFWYLIEHQLNTGPGMYQAILTVKDNNSGEETKRTVVFRLKKGKSTGFVKKKAAPVVQVKEELAITEPAINTPSTGNVDLSVSSGSFISENGLLSLDKNVYFPNEEIKVTFKVMNHFATSAWVGVLPVDCPHGSEKVNDENDISYKRLKYKKYEKGGTMILKAPKKLGNYDIRLNDTDSDGKEMAYVPFTVTTRSDKISLSTSKKTYFPNEEIKIDFKVHPAFAASAWIGIVPNDCPHGSEKVNDENDISYKRLKYKKYNGGGSMTLKAPKNSGTYDVRMHNTDSDGYEVASVTITVK